MNTETVQRFAVDIEIRVADRYWLPVPERKKAAFVKEMTTGLFRDARHPAATAEWEDDVSAIVGIVVSAVSRTDAERTAQAVVVNHAYNRPVELAPEWALETSVRGVAPRP